MGSEPLESCPVCGAECNVSASYFEPGASVLCDRECGYFIHCAVDKIPAGETHECQIAEVHNTLARRAEIGRLVEDVLSKTGYFQVEEESDEHGRMYDVRTQERSSYTDTLLDALRSLAAEIGGKNA